MIDLCKVTFLRARSKNRDAPPFSFDIATIEREWTLSAENNEDLQLWLQLIAAAVDEAPTKPCTLDPLPHHHHHHHHCHHHRHHPNPT